jgi:hypothetical protein
MMGIANMPGWMRKRIVAPKIGGLEVDMSYVKLKPSFWQEISKLPNPVISPSGVGEVVRVSRRSKIALIYFPDAIPGSGHSGIWSYTLGRGPYGHIFVPLEAIQYYSNEDQTKWKRYTYRKINLVRQKGEYPLTAQVANLGNYGMSVTQIAEVLGLSRQAVNEKVLLFPWYLKSQIRRDKINSLLFDGYCTRCGEPTQGLSSTAQYCQGCRTGIHQQQGKMLAHLNASRVAQGIPRSTPGPRNKALWRQVGDFQHTRDIPGFSLKDFLIDDE